MLPDINLDTERFEDIVEEAKNQISALYPEWTDYNYHDPGITMIELFAWLKEIQQYYINQVSIQNKESYLGLLGIKRQHRRSAEARVSVRAKEDFMIPKGSRMFAGDMTFETIRDTYLIAGDIVKCVIESRENTSIINREKLQAKGKLNEYPFGKNPKQGDCFYIGFERPLPLGTSLQICVQIGKNDPVIRNPIDNFTFEPIAILVYEYYAAGQWKTVNLERDGTYSLIQSGDIRFSLDGLMEKVKVGQEEGYFLRLRLQKTEYDIPPILDDISMNLLATRQEETLMVCEDYSVSKVNSRTLTIIKEAPLTNRMEEKVYLKYKDIYYAGSYKKRWDKKSNKIIYKVPLKYRNSLRPDGVRIIEFTEEGKQKSYLGKGDGLPNQEFQIEESQMVYETFQIMIADAIESEGYYEWSKVETFYNSKPMDRHYIFNELNGTILFGDGKFGMVPEGNIFIINSQRTYGSKGNIKADTINQLEGNQYLRIRNEAGAVLGRDTESMEDALRNYRKILKTSHPLITAGDYEELVKQTPGLMIHSCKVISDTTESNMVELVVKPYTLEEQSRLAPSYRTNIIHFLEPRRMIGTKIKILSPEYIEVQLHAEVSIKPHYINGKQQVEEAIKLYFINQEGEFGKPILYTEVYGTIDSLDAVTEVISLQINSKREKASKNVHGDLILPANGIAALQDIQILFVMAER